MSAKLLKIFLIALPVLVQLGVFGIVLTMDGEPLRPEPMTEEEKNSIEHKLRPFTGIIIFGASVLLSIVLWKKYIR